ncbi:neural cell adhesion molecule 1-like [Ptychodera flava]|uniref:neural cell adhesion molecule 1-like n=1 Tax=Ptychodera flava TaxID=63121 RepID=UPI00396A116C
MFHQVQFNGLPPPTYGWLINDSPLPNDDRYQLSESDSKLTITTVDGSDHLTSYTCVVNSDYGSDEKSVTLEVHYQPNIPWPSCQNISSSRGCLQNGDEMTIICETRGGNPFPVLNWFNGSVEMPGQYISQPECDWDCVTSNTYTWKLTKYDNALTVICEGDHSETNKRESCELGPLDVKYSPEVPVCIGKTTNSQSREEGDHFSISCTSMDGNPLATLTWINKTDEQELDKISPNPDDSGSITLEYDG